MNDRVAQARRELALAERQEAALQLAEARDRVGAVLSFDDAADVIEKGHDGRWFRCSADDERRITRSVEGANLVRASRGQSYLEVYKDRGLLMVLSHYHAIEPHPLYTIAELEKREAALRIQDNTTGIHQAIGAVV